MQPLVAKIPWTHHTVILDKVKPLENRLFYINKTAENGWSKNVLSFQIESKLHERQGQAITNFDHTLSKKQSVLAKQTLKSPYIFDFLGLGEDVQERELEKAMIQEIRKLLLELGKGFAYVGNQYHSTRTLRDIRKCYLTFPLWEDLAHVCAKLEWSHIRAITRVSDPLARKYYLIESVGQNWGAR